MTGIIFLKLGGSVITDKTVPYSLRLDSLERLAREIQSALASRPAMQLVIGHGSGSFGHFAVKESLAPHPYPPPAGSGYGASDGFWHGFAEVWYRASQLNRYVVEALHNAGLPVISFAPSSMATADNGAIKTWDATPIKKALEAGLVPVIYGDIVFDSARGATFLSAWHTSSGRRPSCWPGWKQPFGPISLPGCSGWRGSRPGNSRPLQAGSEARTGPM